MTLTDFISKRNNSNPTELCHQLTFNNELQKTNKQHQNYKIKKFHTSVLDLLHIHPSMNNFKHNHQQKESFPQQSSITKPSDIERTIPKKSVTFATVFDSIDKDDINSNLETTTDTELNSEDLITVITNNQITNERTIDTSKNIEPYPFRSEISIPQILQSDSSIDVNISHHSRKKFIQHFIPHRHPKKLRHPINTIDQTTNDQQHSLKTTRKRFRLVFIAHLFTKNSHKKQTNDIKDTKKNHHHHRSQSTELKSLSELLY